MRKIVMGILVLAAVAAAVTGCSRIGLGAGQATKENSVIVAGDGSVRWASVESLGQGSYTKEELIASAGQKISNFNSTLGKAASYENEEGSDKLPVAVVSAEVGNGTAVLITEYDTPGRLVEFAQEIGDYNIPFTQLDTGRAAAMAGELENVSFADEKGQAVDRETVLKDGQKLVVKASGKGLIETEKQVMYVSIGCELKDATHVQTPEEGMGYIILK